MTRTMTARFWDEKDGGFYFTEEGAETAVPRRKEVYDGALPSGNSVALFNLLRLALLTGDSAYEDMASRIMKVFSEDVKRAPAAHTFMLVGIDFAVGQASNVILVGAADEDGVQSMLNALKAAYLPNLVIYLRQPSKAGLGYEKIEGKATAYVCRGQTCMPPTNTAEKMMELLSAR